MLLHLIVKNKGIRFKRKVLCHDFKSIIGLLLTDIISLVEKHLRLDELDSSKRTWTLPNTWTVLFTLNHDNNNN